MKLKPAVAIIALGELCLLSFLEVSRSPQPIDGSSIVAHLSENSGRVITTAHCALPPASWLEVQGQQVIDSGANAILDRSSRYLALIDPSSSHDRPRNQRGPLSRPELLNHPLMNVAAVQAALSAPRPSIERSGGALAAPLLETYALDTYTAAHPLPRARVLFQTVVVKTQTQAAEVVSFRGDELDHLVVVENPPDDFFCQLPSSKPKIEWIEDSANRITLDVDVAEGSGYLLLADAYAPGWSATIDGTQSEILPADLAFRALPIASGKHRVEFEYLPWSLTIGLPLMFAGALLGMISTIVTLLRSRR